MAVPSYVGHKTLSTRTLLCICLLTILSLEWIEAANVTSCHSQCVCLANSTVDCSNKRFTSLPENLPSNTSVLLLSQNQLETLSFQILSRLPLLNKIDLSDNPINCNCSLSWVLIASINIVGSCGSPDAVKGRTIVSLTNHEMCTTCKVHDVSKTDTPTVEPMRSSYIPSDVINVSCPDGYILNGSSVLKCQPDGTWDSATFPKCQATCKIDGSMTDMPTVKPSQSTYFANDVINLSCADGYILNGSSVLKCQADGTWDSGIFPKCQATCKIDVSKTDIPTIKPTNKSPYIPNDVINLSCADGYIVNGSSVLTCQADGTWDSGIFPKCQDEDECKTDIYTCDGNATCKNTMGSYKCICNTGYKGNGKNCSDIYFSSTPAVTPTVKNVTRMTTMAPEERINLMDLIRRTNGTQTTAKSLKTFVEILEEIVYSRKSNDSKNTKDFLHVVSNLMGKQYHATWAKEKQNVRVERLLRAVNEGMKLQAMEMLKNSGTRTEIFWAKFDNLGAEILVDVGEMMANKIIKLPSSRSPQDDYMEFPGSIFKKSGKQKMAVIVISFKHLEKLLPNRSLITDFDTFGADSHVLSGSIISLSDSLSAPVTIKFKNKAVGRARTERTECVFWKYDKTVENFDGKNYRRSLNVSKGGWSNDGCNVSSRDENSTTCKCNHLTDFVVLTSRAEIISYKEIINPSVIIYVGSIFLLIAALIAFIRNIVVWRQTKRERLLVLINQCLAIIIVVVVFVVGIFVDYEETLCIALGALLHWLVLSVFFWILVEDIQLYLSVHFGWNRNSSRVKYFLILGWVIPTIIVGVVLAITQLDDYGSRQWCWYNNSLTLFLSYACPITLCILMCFIFILKVTSLKALMTENTDKKDVSVILALSGFLIPLVAVTCITAALSARQPEKDVFQYLFAVFAILLGIYILLYHCWLDREITKMSVRTNKRTRPKRDYYSTKETVTYSPGTSEGKGFSLIFPSRKSPSHGKKSPKSDTKRSNKRSDSATAFDYDSNVPIYPSINDSSLKSFRSQVSTQQHTLESPPNTLSAITISRPNSQCIELTSLSDLDRRPDGAEQTEPGEHSEFYGSRNSNPLDRVRQRTSGSSDIQNATNATTFGKDSDRPAQDTPDAPGEEENRISTTSSAGISRSSVSGASLGPVEESEISLNEDTLEKEPILRSDPIGPEVRSDPPVKIPKRRKKGSRRRLDDEVEQLQQEQNTEEPKMQTKQKSSSLPSNDDSVKLKQYTGF